MATFYWKSTCTTCRDARTFLRKAGVDFEDVNYAKAPLPEATIEQLVTKAGGVAKVLNTRHAIAKQHAWAEAPPSTREFAKAAAKEPNLLRRPLFVVGARVIVGFDRPAYDKLGR